MDQDTVPTKPHWATCIVGGILAALLFLAVWIPTHPARPHLPTSDLYTHLSVARHLARGEGFQTDVTYPLSFAFPFARELPQPLIHRQPGFGLLLTAPYLATARYPGRALESVRWMQIILLGLTIAAGGAFYFRSGHRAALTPWLVFLLFNPLLAFAVDWGMVELACSLLLMILWGRARETESLRPNWIDGLLAGALAMLRLDLFWVPILWWIVLPGQPKLEPGMSRAAVRRLGFLVLAWLLVTAPWAVRNLRLTGQPAFSLQTYAEHVKDTPAWPHYTVYRQLDPQPLSTTLTTDPVPVLRKVGRGVKFYFRELHKLMPLLVLVGLAGAILAFVAARLKLVKVTPRRRRWDRAFGIPDMSQTRPAALLAATILVLILQYSFFDHSLRHLLVVLPVVLWEISPWIGNTIRKIIFERHQHRGGGSRLVRDLGAMVVLPAAAALLVVFIFPARLPGWDSAAKDAVRSQQRTSQQVDLARSASEGVLFVDNSAVPWFIDRPVVWSPTEKAIRDHICGWLDQPEALPEGKP